jgi:glycosyltransferase involved in cell wall biosynthesis
VRILLVGDYPPDPRLGSTKVLVKLQEEFRSLGHTCDLLLGDALDGAPPNAYLRQAVGPVAAWRAVRRMFRTHGAYDVVDVASAEGLWIGTFKRWLSPRAVVISRSNGLEHLNYQRMLDDHREGLLRKPWTRRLFHPAVRLTQVAGAARMADRLLLLNDTDRAFAVARGWKRPSEIVVVPHGVSDRFLSAAPGRDQTRGRGILFCGSWAEMKGITYLADAFSRLVREGGQPRLTVLGGGVPAETIAAAFSPAARPLVTIVPRVPEDDVMAAYRSHDVFTLPSTYEGFGMVVIEAMSQRLPVVVTPVGCVPSLVVPEETGLIVPPRNEEALARAFQRLLQNPDLRRRIGDAAHERVRDMSWANTARRTLEVYADALHSNRRVQ